MEQDKKTIEKIIKTTFKQKIGKNVSYPLGAKELSKQLEDVPQFNNLSLVFRKEFGLHLGIFVPGWSLRYLKGNAGRTLLGFREIIRCTLRDEEWKITINTILKRT